MRQRKPGGCFSFEVPRDLSNIWEKNNNLKLDAWERFQKQNRSGL